VANDAAAALGPRPAGAPIDAALAGGQDGSSLS